MLTISTNTEERLTTAHRAKLAFIYVRQSSVNQVRQHQESTELSGGPWLRVQGREHLALAHPLGHSDN